MGGGLDATHKAGRFNADSYGLELRFDSDGSKRANVDINRILIPNKVALRFAALSTDQRTPRELQYMRRNSAYLNLTLQPFKGATINLNAETGRIDELNPRPYLAYDSVSAWLNDPALRSRKRIRSTASWSNPAARRPAMPPATLSPGFPKDSPPPIISST